MHEMQTILTDVRGVCQSVCPSVCRAGSFGEAFVKLLCHMLLLLLLLLCPPTQSLWAEILATKQRLKVFYLETTLL